LREKGAGFVNPLNLKEERRALQRKRDRGGLFPPQTEVCTKGKEPPCVTKKGKKRVLIPSKGVHSGKRKRGVVRD